VAQFPFTNVRDLCLAALPLFNPLSLTQHEKRVLQSPSTTQIRCPEAQYAMELYRCLYKVLEGKTSLHAEFSYAADGRLDLFIRERRWAIELLRDENRTKEHVQRFRPGGNYHGWGIIEDYILLDFCTKWPTNRDHTGKQVNIISYRLLTIGTIDPYLYHIIFNEEHDFVTIINSTDQKIKMPHTPLLY
jgi:hypothetical protein